MRAAFHTFGCKLNQFETEALASAFAGQGFALVPPGEPAELYLINTCTVTSRSEQKARRYLRHLAQERPNALLLVTGCYAQLARSELEALGANLLVVSQDDKPALLELPRLLSQSEALRPGSWRERARAALREPAPQAGQAFRFQVTHYRFHSRAFLKIQDGCDHRCAYCRVPLARGRSISLDPAAVVAQAQALQASGYRELVLTGVNISSYRSGEVGLARLLERLLAATAEVRLRLSSLEPETIKPDLIRVLAHPRICPHFHLSVQSGSDRILLSMRRRYRSVQVERAVVELQGVKAQPFLAADLIAGFPGESDADYQATYDQAERLGFAKLHVFPFSPRAGTAAHSMRGRVAERIRDTRVRELVSLSARLEERYRLSWEGREVQVVLENRHLSTPEGEAWEGTSENYLKVRVYGIPPELAGPGRLISARITGHGNPCGGRYLAGGRAGSEPEP
jgi:threonylcarbamoyladenosine tRNA methylthiotransferase MtaB